MIEIDQYIAPDGEVYNLTDLHSTYVLTSDNTGMPDVEYITQKGPFQHGETVVDYFLQPRILDLVISKATKCRRKYWEERTRILDALRPNRGAGPGVLRKVFSGGTTIDIDVRILQGPKFTKQRGIWNEFGFEELIRFIAHNPIYYDPEVNTHEVTLPISDIIFPITFPFTTTGPFIDTFNISYGGNWIEYPTIILTGPFYGFSIKNNTTDEEIVLDYNVSIGETVTITLLYGTKTVVSSTGADLIDKIAEGGDMGTFHFTPGTNSITIHGAAKKSGTKVTIQWKDRYIGLGG